MSADHPLDDHYSSNDSVESFSSAVGDAWSQSTASERHKLVTEKTRGHSEINLQAYFVSLE